MRCFNHPTHEASGVCRNCGRGVCSDCIVIVEEAVACRGRCEQRVTAIQRMVHINMTNLRTTAGQVRRAGLNAVFTGLLFVAMGCVFMSFVGNDFGRYMGALFLGLGLLVFIRGIGTMWASRSYKKMAVEASSPSGNPTTERFG